MSVGPSVTWSAAMLRRCRGRPGSPLEAVTAETLRFVAAHRKALEVFSHGQLPWRRAEALLAWADWLERTGRLDAAVTMRADAVEVYDGLDAHPRWRRQVTAVHP